VSVLNGGGFTPANLRNGVSSVIRFLFAG